MTKNRNLWILALTALIWGVAFVAQRAGGDAIGPYTFCCFRSLIGAAVLTPVIAMTDRRGANPYRPTTRAQRKHLIIAGICCGLCLGFATILQQLGMILGTSASKAGFLTACYIILVPLVGIFFKRRCGANVWLAVIIALVGLYLLCMKSGSLHMQSSDILVLLCSLLFCLHILVIDHFANHVDVVRMSRIQFLVAAVVAFVPMCFAELRGNGQNWLAAFRSLDAWIPLLYAGILSSGVAYTLQTIGQKGVNPTSASLVLSLESVFSALAGWLILKESLSPREILGCVVVFIAIILAQLPEKRPAKRAKSELS